MEEKGFFASLFDFSFSSLITTKIVKVVYTLSIIIIILNIVFSFIIAMNSKSPLLIFLTLIISPVYFLFTACLVRFLLESVIIIYRSMELTRDIANKIDLLINSFNHNNPEITKKGIKEEKEKDDIISKKNNFKTLLKCKKCGSDINISYLKPGEIVHCKNCFTENIVPYNPNKMDENKLYQYICTNCGESISEENMICPNCGTDLSKIKCPYCAEEIDKSFIKCPFCRSVL